MSLDAVPSNVVRMYLLRITIKCDLVQFSKKIRNQCNFQRPVSVLFYLVLLNSLLELSGFTQGANGDVTCDQYHKYKVQELPDNELERNRKIHKTEESWLWK